MFKFKSYNIKKAEEKNEKGKSTASFSTGTLKKSTNTTRSEYVSPKTKTMPTKKEIEATSNKQSPEYSKKIYPKKTVTKWQKNTTYSPKKETEKIVIPSPHKKLERK